LKQGKNVSGKLLKNNKLQIFWLQASRKKIKYMLFAGFHATWERCGMAIQL
jgi:hypothetical protein